MHKSMYILILAVIFSFVLTNNIFAGSSANHDVTVTVSAINEISVSGGNITLTINTATAGSNPDAQSDSTTTDLLWTTNEASKKITVASGTAISSATLTVTASNVSGGTSAGAITLSDSAQDFVTGISTTVGNCDLSYQASATAAQGTSSNTYTITYTITAAL